jgi:TolB-like protein
MKRCPKCNRVFEEQTLNFCRADGIPLLSGHLSDAARTSAFSFNGKDVSVRDIGKALHVEAVLEGSIRKVGNRMRITVRLVSTTTGYQLYSEQYDGEMCDTD